MNGEKQNGEFEELIEMIKATRGFDFGIYKKSSLQRRFDRRIQAVGLSSYAAYMDRLEADPSEFQNLFNTVLINATSFFRDTESWKYLSEELVPSIVQSKPKSAQMRVWSAGCSTGEEAYSIAMLFAEEMGVDDFCAQVKVYATDLDDRDLNIARLGTFTEKQMNDVPEEFKQKYFEFTNNTYVFNKDMRRCIIFGKHDVSQDAPISRIDLLLCRNTLMYFNAESQARILEKLYFALNNDGYLFLGRAEMLMAHKASFEPVDLRRRVFRKNTNPGASEGLIFLGLGDDNPGSSSGNHDKLREYAGEFVPNATIILDEAGNLAITNEKARVLFGLSQKDIGAPFQDLEVSYKPVELRSLTEQAMRERQTVTLRDVEAELSGEIRIFDVQVIPLTDRSGVFLGIEICFYDTTVYRRLQEDVRAGKQELEAAYEELQSTNEELETTNEEFQSANEELETTNEELQSANEELETMNEELQSTNEELQTMNTELKDRTAQLDESNSYLKSILGSLQSGIAVLDKEFQIRVWNHMAEEFWGVRQDEAPGKHFLNLDIGLPVGDLRPVLLRAMNSDEPGHLVMKATNRRGRPFECKVSCSALLDGRGKTTGVIVLMEEHVD